jgi:hypothetical protein
LNQSICALVSILVFANISVATNETQSDNSMPQAPASQALDNIKQEKRIVDRAVEILNKDQTMQARIASGTKILGVYDSGKRYRCDCYDMLVKFKQGPQTWIETVKVAEGKATWLK